MIGRPRPGWPGSPTFTIPSWLGGWSDPALPTLIVWGAQDRLFPPALGEAYAAEIPGARLAVIDQCGHSPHNEQPAELARIVTEFLATSE